MEEWSGAADVGLSPEALFFCEFQKHLHNDGVPGFLDEAEGCQYHEIHRARPFRFSANPELDHSKPEPMNLPTEQWR
jgi:hypothetical protein